MVTILPKENDWSDAFANIGGGLVQGYTNRADEMALQKAVASLPENHTPRELIDAVTGAKTYNPQSKQTFFKTALRAREFEEKQKENKIAQERIRLADEEKKAEKLAKETKEKTELESEKNDAKQLVQYSELPDEQKQQLIDDIDAGKATTKSVKEIVKPKKEATSPFKNALAKKHVDQYVDAEKSIIQSQRNLNDLDRLDELTNQLAGPLGYFEAANPFSQEASELTALGFAAIEPIVKTFNPSGPIAQKKLEQLQKIFAINRFDSSATARGKTTALRRFANYAKDIAEQRIALFKEYDGSPPIGEIARLDAKGEALIDQMSKEDPTKPQIFYSKANGRQVKAPDLATQEKWLKEGIITDVKP